MNQLSEVVKSCEKRMRMMERERERLRSVTAAWELRHHRCSPHPAEWWHQRRGEAGLDLSGPAAPVA